MSTQSIAPAIVQADTLTPLAIGAEIVVTMDATVNPVIRGGATGIRAKLIGAFPGAAVFILWADAAHTRELIRVSIVFAAAADDFTVMLPNGAFVPFFAQPRIQCLSGPVGATYTVTPIILDIAPHR